MAMKSYSTFPKDPELELHHQIVSCHIRDNKRESLKLISMEPIEICCLLICSLHGCNFHRINMYFGFCSFFLFFLIQTAKLMNQSIFLLSSLFSHSWFKIYFLHVVFNCSVFFILSPFHSCKKFLSLFSNDKFGFYCPIIIFL